MRALRARVNLACPIISIGFALVKKPHLAAAYACAEARSPKPEARSPKPNSLDYGVGSGFCAIPRMHLLVHRMISHVEAQALLKIVADIRKIGLEPKAPPKSLQSRSSAETKSQGVRLPRAKP